MAPYDYNDITFDSYVPQRLSALDEQIAQLEQQQSLEPPSGLDFASSPATGQDMIAAALTMAAPTLLGGLISGKQGALAGLSAAGRGGEVYHKSRAAEDLARQKSEALRGDSIAKRLEKASTEKEKLMLRSASEKKKDARAAKSGVTINNMPGDKASWDVNAKKRFDAADTFYQHGRALMAYTDMVAPGMLKEKPPVNPKTGSIEWRNLAPVLKREFDTWAWGANTKEGAAQMKFGRMLAAYVKEISGVAVAKEEFERLKGYIKGDGLIPAAWPVTLHLIQDEMKQKRRDAIQTAERQRFYDEFGGATDATAFLDRTLPTDNIMSLDNLFKGIGTERAETNSPQYEYEGEQFTVITQNGKQGIVIDGIFRPIASE